MNKGFHLVSAAPNQKTLEWAYRVYDPEDDIAWLTAEQCGEVGEDGVPASAGLFSAEEGRIIFDMFPERTVIIHPRRQPAMIETSTDSPPESADIGSDKGGVDPWVAFEDWWRLRRGRCPKCNSAKGIKGCSACFGIGGGWYEH